MEDIVVALIEVDEVDGYKKKDKLQIEIVETENFIRKDRNVLVVRKKSISFPAWDWTKSVTPGWDARDSLPSGGTTPRRRLCHS
jgi:hypothetical protein